MSIRRRIVSAVAVFAVAAGLLAVADAKPPTAAAKPADVAKQIVLARAEIKVKPPKPPAPEPDLLLLPMIKEPPYANRYLPNSKFGGY